LKITHGTSAPSGGGGAAEPASAPAGAAGAGGAIGVGASWFSSNVPTVPSVTFCVPENMLPRIAAAVAAADPALRPLRVSVRAFSDRGG